MATTTALVLSPHLSELLQKPQPNEAEMQMKRQSHIGTTHFKLVVGISTDFCWKKCMHIATERNTLFSQRN